MGNRFKNFWTKNKFKNFFAHCRNASKNMAIFSGFITVSIAGIAGCIAGGILGLFILQPDLGARSMSNLLQVLFGAAGYLAGRLIGFCAIQCPGLILSLFCALFCSDEEKEHVSATTKFLYNMDIVEQCSSDKYSCDADYGPCGTYRKIAVLLLGQASKRMFAEFAPEPKQIRKARSDAKKELDRCAMGSIVAPGKGYVLPSLT
jgi:hypothetical protein